MTPCSLLCVIDDDPVYQYTVRRHVMNSKLADRIQVFPDGEAAIDHFRAFSGMPQELPDVVLLDINMPIMDGWTFLEEFVKIQPMLHKHIVIYMVSSSIHDADVQRAQSISMLSGYYIKPIAEQELRTMITRIEDGMEGAEDTPPDA